MTHAEWWADLKKRWSRLSVFEKIVLVFLSPVVIPIWAISYVIGTALAVTDELLRRR